MRSRFPALTTARARRAHAIAAADLERTLAHVRFVPRPALRRAILRAPETAGAKAPPTSRARVAPLLLAGAVIAALVFGFARLLTRLPH